MSRLTTDAAKTDGWTDCASMCLRQSACVSLCAVVPMRLYVVLRPYYVGLSLWAQCTRLCVPACVSALVNKMVPSA